MELVTFFEKFDQFADAPDAVAKMRELILGLAVQGRLVSQLDSDESAENLIKFAAERSRASVNAAKYQKLAAQAHDLLQKTELPSLPYGWVWTCSVVIGDTAPRVDADDNAQAAFAPMNLLPTDYRSTFKPELRTWRDIKKGYTHFADGDVAFAKITPCFQNGKGCVFADLPGGIGAGTTELHVLRPFKDVVLPLYALLFYKSPKFVIGGIASFSGTAGQQRVSNDYFRFAPFPLPPLAEQKRIVAKVDELMGLCDRLEAKHQEREEQGHKLARASLARFADAPTPANLEYLFHPSYAISPADLRKTILTLAVQGKLVPQDPNDEPAEELIGRIAANKLRLQKSGEIGREKPVEPLLPERLPFETPSSWRWGKLAELTELITKGSSPKWQGIEYVSESEGILFITSENVGNYLLRKLDDLKYVSRKFNEIEPRSILKRGDILMNLVGASIGRTAAYDLHDGANINQAVALIRLVRETDGVCPGFLLHYLNSPAAIQYMLSSRVVNAQPNFSLSDAREIAVPIPPLAEQRRIVAKVEQLMALVDALEQQLAASRETASKLLNAIVAELTTT